jgi:hypothetical protein
MKPQNGGMIHASATPADTPDLPIEFDIVGMTRLRNGGRIAALGLTVCRQRRVAGQARIGRQRRRDGWIGRSQAAVPHMTVTQPSVRVAMATPGKSTGAPCQSQNDPRQDQLAHTHYNHPAPGFTILEHDLRANASGVCREGKPVPTFPDHASSVPHSSRGWCRAPRQIV